MARIQQADIGTTLENFFRVHTERAVIVFQPKRIRDRFIQFRIARDEDGNKILVFGFPDAPWSRDYYRMIFSELTKCGFSPMQVSTGESRIREFLEVEISSVDVSEQGTKIAKVAFAIMEVTSNSSLGVRTNGPFESTPQFQEYKQRIEQSIERHTNMSRNPKAGFLTRLRAKLTVKVLKWLQLDEDTVPRDSK